VSTIPIEAHRSAVASNGISNNVKEGTEINNTMGKKLPAAELGGRGIRKKKKEAMTHQLDIQTPGCEARLFLPDMSNPVWAKVEGGLNKSLKKKVCERTTRDAIIPLGQGHT
jgi:hypothetical protein